MSIQKAIRHLSRHLEIMRVILRCAQDLSASRDRPFAALRVTWGDGSNCHVRFVPIEPCLTCLNLKEALCGKTVTYSMPYRPTWQNLRPCRPHPAPNNP